ncbi:hypothetical protein EDE09_101210 [Neorhizobium sp. S3-V5DH]|nr:hypothetical protein EDE09_101210 [Neorhizobium sp. S3-V5DH]
MMHWTLLRVADLAIQRSTDVWFRMELLTKILNAIRFREEYNIRGKLALYSTDMSRRRNNADLRPAIVNRPRQTDSVELSRYVYVGENRSYIVSGFQNCDCLVRTVCHHGFKPGILNDD